jgi:hypothetical protein
MRRGDTDLATLDRWSPRHHGVRVRRVVAFLLSPVLLLGCGVVTSQSDAVMCDVATGLITAHALAQEASVKDGSGDKDAARQLAGQARTIAQDEYDRLQTITSGEVQRGATWRALLSAYLHVGQGANALLPDYANTYGITKDELATASEDLRTAAADLPARCFTVSESPAGGV